MRRTLTILGAGAVLATGSGVAIGASRGATTAPTPTPSAPTSAGLATPARIGARPPAAERDAYLDDVARRLGVTRARLGAAFRAMRGDDRGRGLGRGLGLGLHRRGGIGGDGILAAAEHLDLSFTQLRQALRTRTLAQVAQDRKGSVDGLKAAIRAAAVEALDAAVAGERLTAAQRTAALGRLDASLDDVVNGRSPFVTALARELDLERGRVVGALREAALARVDAARRDGDLTEARADRLRERIRSGEGALGLRGGGRHGGRGHGPRGADGPERRGASFGPRVPGAIS